ncbi:hypothetical protein CO057_02030 [Candidatus Uhrbacteria bacterium CG_4_9_14_0_2_um_filter_41_50]|uniref:Uncharacterized protein n=1 Tax=Candidatus Uhrbacteria bacterium CG_4_9_14_0_2_um_filter_41_50 TaxID=1975031 RepID=A0A2M8EPC2_9BACT|nr:MAG: hypothetical protein COZ45_01400 [Candidatus Uhrbacteria bacterium CG_4_10_14_3_um_filter_41_21]PIZ55433.1 MAG: hypothetical protein COY24_00180 [Candidatus Uhrbacteria bacterium CG_4_10_14_0_2_um_filter_41_21]PJB84614.1 MAG: hypothetical protein CO086_02535 [Candidatus Uhrbacteria bacterium CG_4_9_14_0_8_um_filter_41_16]PJC24595.1 MAG: hypothetical protein CO057_02030 [Candidatus Uhrbacteria bacterium CG_4_9_14_0_2_um_filter_41_50]PJE74994.1 MAG: hypothetical protein COV03_02495 [Candi
MKKILLFLGALALIGADCIGGTKTVEGDWYLAFDLPSDWVMTTVYSEGTMPIGLDGVSLEDSEIYLQSSSLHMIFDDSEVPEEFVEKVGEVKRDDMTRISILRLSSRRHLPDDVEDLGDGFYKLGDLYYFEGESGDKYMFTVEQMGQDISVAQEVILSAKEVTVNQQ